MNTTTFILVKGIVGIFILLAVWLTSCAANKSCHGNGRKYHVDRSVRRAQARPYAYRH